MISAYRIGELRLTEDVEVTLKCFYAGKCGNTHATLDVLQQLGASLNQTSSLEMVDLMEHPQLAQEYNILALPTLLRVAPHPPIRLVGELSDLEKVRTVLQLD